MSFRKSLNPGIGLRGDASVRPAQRPGKSQSAAKAVQTAAPKPIPSHSPFVQDRKPLGQPGIGSAIARTSVPSPLLTQGFAQWYAQAAVSPGFESESSIHAPLLRLISRKIRKMAESDPDIKILDLSSLSNHVWTATPADHATYFRIESQPQPVLLRRAPSGWHYSVFLPDHASSHLSERPFTPLLTVLSQKGRHPPGRLPVFLGQDQLPFVLGTDDRHRIRHVPLSDPNRFLTDFNASLKSLQTNPPGKPVQREWVQEVQLTDGHTTLPYRFQLRSEQHGKSLQAFITGIDAPSGTDFRLLSGGEKAHLPLGPASEEKPLPFMLVSGQAHNPRAGWRRADLLLTGAGMAVENQFAIPYESQRRKYTVNSRLSNGMLDPFLIQLHTMEDPLTGTAQVMQCSLSCSEELQAGLGAGGDGFRLEEPALPFQLDDAPTLTFTHPLFNALRFQAAYSTFELQPLDRILPSVTRRIPEFAQSISFASGGPALEMTANIGNPFKPKPIALRELPSEASPAPGDTRRFLATGSAIPALKAWMAFTGQYVFFRPPLHQGIVITARREGGTEYAITGFKGYLPTP